VRPWKRWKRLAREQRTTMANTASVSDAVGVRSVTSIPPQA
jgi:hypothetical protein